MSQKGVIAAPSKAINAGGISVSGLEMSENRGRISWTAEKIDARKNIHAASVEAAEGYSLGYNLAAGANIASFQKVADAIMAQGIV